MEVGKCSSGLPAKLAQGISCMTRVQPVSCRQGVVYERDSVLTKFRGEPRGELRKPANDPARNESRIVGAQRARERACESVLAAGVLQRQEYL